MKIEYDPAKSERNLRTRGLSFDMVFDLDWGRAMVFEDERRDYGEKRLVALIPLDERLYVVCYTRRADVRRIISFRKANKREVKIYAEETADE